MGDSHRHWELAKFVARTFPEATRVADVAGGHGVVAFFLRELGLASTTIDTRDTGLPRRMRRQLRKRSVAQGRLIEVPRIVADIRELDLSEFDLVVALHPDEATEPTVRAAVEQHKAFAIVPCCVFSLDGVKRSREGWVDYLASLAPGATTDTLPIDGANKVVWRRTPKA
ncbi:methyltransferase [Candidatus Sumerlaeota bacterium]